MAAAPWPQLHGRRSRAPWPSKLTATSRRRRSIPSLSSSPSSSPVIGAPSSPSPSPSPSSPAVGECIEEMMDSESNRRVLAMQRRFISYETLKRDLVPCTRPGSSYYNCRAAGAANPYNRGCEVITGCARDISDIKS
ncbi:hypothetical protein Vadar_008134 [Vaccinium darrowii]|uniref:Uncharacterized protein n=1 Tax=Vaccinium darrowii TaxID=229202 RepID=A0ACB7WZ87_9ERIC|nr:hypothetical protein Vadar_008134 [Vaccinium darrowii]